MTHLTPLTWNWTPAADIKLVLMFKIVNSNSNLNPHSRVEMSLSFLNAARTYVKQMMHKKNQIEDFADILT